MHGSVVRLVLNGETAAGVVDGAVLHTTDIPVDSGGAIDILSFASVDDLVRSKKITELSKVGDIFPVRGQYR